MSKRLNASRYYEYSDFDCGEVDPDTLKEWEAEFRRKNYRDMHSYLKHFPDATPEEKKALRSWVKSGHSPYENADFFADESGSPMDFIHAMRFWEDVYQDFLKNPEDFRANFGLDDNTSDPALPPGPDDDLPF